MLSVSSKQTAVPGTPSTSNAPISPALSYKATLSSSKPAPELDSSLLPAELAMNAQQEHAPTPSCTNTIAAKTGSNPDPQLGSDRLAHLGTNDPRLVHIPYHTGAFAEDPGDSGGVPMVENGALPPLADPDSAALTFMAKTTDADTGMPAPCMPAEAKRSHDRPPWEKPTESPITHKTCTTVQGLSQSGSVNTDDPNQSDHGGHTIHPLQPAHTDATFPRYQLTDHNLPPLPVDHLVRPLTDPAPTSTVECAITCNMPHCKAINTSSWATLLARPATTLTDVNSSMAVYQCAKLGHMFPIDGSTMAPLSRQKEDTPSPTIGSTHNAMTHGSQEASCLCSPVSGASIC